jgi:hypothetical protein
MSLGRPLVSKKRPRALSVTELQKIAGEIPSVIDLPDSILKGIGMVLSAFAYMESRLSVVLYTLLGLDQPEGRIAFGYANPNARLKVIRLLLEWNGIQSPVEYAPLVTKIDECSAVRDQLAHGMWGQAGDKIVLQTVRGHTDIEGLRLRHDFLPATIDVSGDYFKVQRAAILDAVKQIDQILETAKAAHEARRAAIIAAQISNMASRKDDRSES